MSGESIKNTPIDTAPVPDTKLNGVAEQMLAKVEGSEATGKRALDAINTATEALKNHPEKMDQFVEAMGSFGKGMERRNDAARDGQKRTLDQIGMQVPGETFEGSKVETRIAGVIAKLSDGLKSGAIKPEDVGVMLTLAQLDDQVARAEADAYGATSQGAVARKELPEEKEAKGGTI